MKRYKFKMEPLLVKRQTLEEQCQQELAEQSRILGEHQKTLTDAFEEYRRHRLQAEVTSLSPADLALFTNYANALMDLIEEAKQRVRDQRKIVDEIKQRLTKLHREKKVVEILKEKDREAYMQEAKRIEDRQMDEHSTIRHAGNINRRRNSE